MKKKIFALFMIIIFMSFSTGCMIVTDLVDLGLIDEELVYELKREIMQEVKNALIDEMQKSITEYKNELKKNIKDELAASIKLPYKSKNAIDEPELRTIAHYKIGRNEYTQVELLSEYAGVPVNTDMYMMVFYLDKKGNFVTDTSTLKKLMFMELVLGTASADGNKYDSKTLLKDNANSMLSTALFQANTIVDYLDDEAFTSVLGDVGGLFIAIASGNAAKAAIEASSLLVMKTAINVDVFSACMQMNVIKSYAQAAINANTTFMNIWDRVNQSTVYTYEDCTDMVLQYADLYAKCEYLKYVTNPIISEIQEYGSSFNLFLSRFSGAIASALPPGIVSYGAKCAEAFSDGIEVNDLVSVSKALLDFGASRLINDNIAIDLLLSDMDSIIKLREYAYSPWLESILDKEVITDYYIEVLAPYQVPELENSTWLKYCEQLANCLKNNNPY